MRFEYAVGHEDVMVAVCENCGKAITDDGCFVMNDICLCEDCTERIHMAVKKTNPYLGDVVYDLLYGGENWQETPTKERTLIAV